MKNVIQNWHPEDENFWNAQGSKIANRNLMISIPALFLAFAIWMIWSVVATKLNSVGFNFTTDQLFWLTALPALSGATLRIFYSFLVPVFGGRRWTAISTLTLVAPALWLGIAVQDTSTSYSTFIVIALLCGFGGGNFASSMSNISFFYPKRKAGIALGLNAGLGNLGVSAMQFIVPAVIGLSIIGTSTGSIWLQNAGFVWVLPILIVTILAWFFMDDLAVAKASIQDQLIIFNRKHTWIMSWIYLGTFGSFIGYAAAFPMLVKTQFPEINVLQYSFIGPLLGAATRPIGGWLADKFGGAKVTLWNFAIMAIAVLGLIYFLPQGSNPGNFFGFFSMFLVLFITTGIGNGSTFRMIPVIFRGFHEKSLPVNATNDQQLNMAKISAKESAAVIGFSSAIGAYGGFFIPKGFGSAMKSFGSAEIALYAFLTFYITCIVATWWWYARKNAESPS